MGRNVFANPIEQRVIGRVLDDQRLAGVHHLQDFRILVQTNAQIVQLMIIACRGHISKLAAPSFGNDDAAAVHVRDFRDAPNDGEQDVAQIQ